MNPQDTRQLRRLIYQMIVAYAGAGEEATDHGTLSGLTDDDHTIYAKKASNLSDLASASTARTNLGLGALATASTVSNGDWSGDDLAVTNGGTGASTAADALVNLGLTATAAELNALDGITATVTELNYTDGVTSAIQTQLDAKQAEPSEGAFVDGDKTKLDGIETGADVTDTANVTSAGALMDSEVTSLSGIKSLTVPDSTTISTFGASLIDDAAASNARTTLGLGTLATASTINNSNWSGTDLSVANGGTGRSTATTAYGLIAAGTTATGAQQTISPGTSGHFLKSAGASALGSFAAITEADISDLDHDAVKIRGVAVDSTVGSPSDGDILVYRSAGSDFVLEAKPASGSNPALNDVTDVDINSVADNDILAYDSSSGDWLNQSASEAGIASSSDLSTHESDTTTHGATGAVVGTTNAQTLTNKTIDAQSNTLENFGWQQIGEHELGSAADVLSVSSLPAYRFLKVEVHAFATGGTINGLIEFNGDTTSTNYNRRYEINGAADAAANAQPFIHPATAAENLACTFEVMNIAARQKIIYQGDGVSTAPSRIQFSGKWTNATNAISQVTITNSGTGSYDTGSILQVWGHN